MERPTFGPGASVRLHAGLTVAWFLVLPAGYFLGWLESVVFVSLASIYANFVGHFSSLEAARGARRQEEIHKENVGGAST